MNYTTLIPAAELWTQLKNPDLVLLDCRHDLVDPEAGRAAYRESHIPGAQFVHLDRDLSGHVNGNNGRHPLPAPNVFSTTLGNFGVNATKQVVAYDASGGMYAARLWWMLRWLGHTRVAVLDGAWQNWLAQGFSVTKDVSTIQTTTFSGSPQDNWVDVHFVETHLNRPELLLIDARSPERFHGIGETLDRVGGHIPGALNRFFKDNLGANGCFKTAQELKRDFSELVGTTPTRNVVHQCGSGVTACHNLLAMEIAGLKGAKLYAGSWSEWCSDHTRPTEI